MIDCTDATVATLSYNYLAENCTAADTSYPFEWAGIFDTPDSSYTWVSQAATDATDASGKKYTDDPNPNPTLTPTPTLTLTPNPPLTPNPTLTLTRYADDSMIVAAFATTRCPSP